MDDRRLEVLRAIIEDYVQTREPVGSKAITERHHLGVSPATIRNDMAMLEEAGYIAQPHTSAGRIPTELGYRHFVDRLTEVKPLSHAERNAIESFLTQAVDLDDVVTRAARLVAQLTRQVAVVQYPSLRGATLRHLELVQLDPTHLLAVVITDSGRVEQHTLAVTKEVDDDDLATLRRRLNEIAHNKRFDEIAEELDGLSAEFPVASQDTVEMVASALSTSLVGQKDDRMVLTGTANLVRDSARFAQNLEPVLDALEEQVVLLRLLTQMSQDGPAVSVRIGTETQHDGLSQASVVTTSYGPAPGQSSLIGSIGPTSIDYPGTIAAVRAVATYLARIVGH